MPRSPDPPSTDPRAIREGLDQLLKAGVAQQFELADAIQRVPLLGAVGPLQFEVMQYRLETEYSADCRAEPVPPPGKRQLHKWRLEVV